MKLKEKLKKKQPEKKNKGISEKKSFKEKIKSSFNGKYIKNGSYSMLISVIFIVIFIVLNMIVNALPTKYSEIDVSDQKLFSIGKQTEDFLKKLDKDVTIYQIAQSGAEDETVSKLLKKYEEASDHIKVEKKDPVVNPKFTSEYTDAEVSSNSLIVKFG